MITAASVRRLLAAATAGSFIVACNGLLGSREIFLEVDGGNSAACGDSKSDPHHCGRCGHSCLGGMCREGACQPSAVQSGISPFSVGVDATRIFWSEPFAGRVAQINKDLTGLVDLSLGGQRAPISLVVDSDNVYFTSMSSHSIFRCRVGGCGNAPAKVMGDVADLRDLFVDESTLFWITGNRVLALQRLPSFPPTPMC